MTTLPDIVTIPAFAPASDARRPKRALRRAPLPRVRFVAAARAAAAEPAGEPGEAQPLGMIILLVK